MNGMFNRGSKSVIFVSFWGVLGMVKNGQKWSKMVKNGRFSVFCSGAPLKCCRLILGVFWGVFGVFLGCFGGSKMVKNDVLGFWGFSNLYDMFKQTE
jgi:hypothetical protein